MARFAGTQFISLGTIWLDEWKNFLRLLGLCSLHMLVGAQAEWEMRANVHSQASSLSQPCNPEVAVR